LIAFALSLLLAQLPTPAPGPQATAPADPKQLYVKMKCAFCHGEDGKGDTEKGRKLHAPDFTSAKFQRETTDKEMVDAIQNGIKSKKGAVLMPAFKSKLSPDEIRVLAGYVRSFGPPAK
jgi:mono/diheme cytochrome c family protein